MLTTFFVTALLPCLAIAQAPPDELLEQVRAAFRRLEYEQVDSLAREALRSHTAFEPAALVEMHTLLGLSQFYRGREQGAREQFESALTLNPSLQMDPMLAAPQALAFFDAVRASHERSPRDSPSNELVRYVFVRDERPAAAVRSFLVPGWGQLYKNERLKGFSLVALWAGTAGGGVAAHFAHERARTAYEDAASDEVQARYDTMNRWHKLRKRLALGAVVVWGISAVDAVVSGGPTGPSTIAGPQLSVSLDGEALRPGLLLRARF